MATVTAVETAIVEIQAAIASLTPKVAGAVFLSELDLQPDTHAAVTAEIEDFTRRLTLLNQGLTALQALMADNYPAVPPRDVTPSVLADLQQAVLAIEAAFGLFGTDIAVTLGFTASAPEPK